MKITQPKQAVNLALNVDASGVGYDDTGGFFGGGTLTLAEILALIGAGLAPGAFLRSTGGEVHYKEDHEELAATEVFDLANANIHRGTLDGTNSAITIVGWPVDRGGYTRLSLTGDGASLATLPDVTWIGSAPSVIGLGDVLHMTVFSDDAGTTQWGAVVGGGTASSDGLVPYLIEAGETYTVPVKKQALFNYPITVDPGGSLVVNGYLLAVS